MLSRRKGGAARRTGLIDALASAVSSRRNSAVCQIEDAATVIFPFNAS